MKVKILKVILILIVLAALALYWIHARSEEKSSRISISLCQFVEVAHQLTSYYSNNSKYPNEASWVNSIDSTFVAKQCSGELIPTMNSFRDVLGATYKYEKLGEDSIIISRITQNDEYLSKSFPQRMTFVRGKIR
jgi:hypothetical protein